MSTKMGRVVIGGGTGFVGAALAGRLKAAGRGVVLVSRRPGPDRITWEELRRTGLPPHTSAVVSLAGQNLLDPTRRWTEGFKQNVWASRVQTTRYLAEAIEKAEVKPEVFVSMSGVGYYPTGSDTHFTEDSPGGDSDYLTRLAADWEEAASLPPELGVRGVTYRCGVVIGRGSGMIQQLILPYWLGLGGPVGRGTQPMPWIHLHDAAGLLEHCIVCTKVRGPLNAVAPHLVTNAAFSKAFAGALGRPAFIPLPAFAVNLIFNGDRAALLTQGQWVTPKKALDTGYSFQYPDIESACRECAHLFPSK